MSHVCHACGLKPLRRRSLGPHVDIEQPENFFLIQSQRRRRAILLDQFVEELALAFKDFGDAVLFITYKRVAVCRIAPNHSLARHCVRQNRRAQPLRQNDFPTINGKNAANGYWRESIGDATAPVVA
jgi:hypothetical protein